MKWVLVMGIGVLILVLTAIVGWMAVTQSFDPPPRLRAGFSSPILALELVRSADEARSIFRGPLGCGNCQVIRKQIDEDWYFIAAYTTTFAGMGLLLSQRRLPGAWIVSGIVIFLAAGAAAFDVRENLGILRILDAAPDELSDEMAIATRHASLIKWGLIFAILLALSLLFWVRVPGGLVVRLSAIVAGSALVGAAALGFVGLASNPMIEHATRLMALGLAVACPLFLAVPDSFLRPPEERRAPRP